MATIATTWMLNWKKCHLQFWFENEAVDLVPGTGWHCHTQSQHCNQFTHKICHKNCTVLLFRRAEATLVIISLMNKQRTSAKKIIKKNNNKTVCTLDWLVWLADSLTRQCRRSDRLNRFGLFTFKHHEQTTIAPPLWSTWTHRMTNGWVSSVELEFICDWTIFGFEFQKHDAFASSDSVFYSEPFNSHIWTAVRTAQRSEYIPILCEKQQQRWAITMTVTTTMTTMAATMMSTTSTEKTTVNALLSTWVMCGELYKWLFARLIVFFCFLFFSAKRCFGCLLGCC